MNLKYYVLTLASFNMQIPFQPLGVINIKYIFPLLVPAGLVAIVSAVAILSFMLVVSKRSGNKACFFKFKFSN